MAELADVEQSLLDGIITAFYPTGADTASVLGIPLRIYRGQPTNATLRIDRCTGTIDVAIYALAETTRNTTRWGIQVAELLNTPTLTVGTSGSSATFFGSASPGDLAGVLINQQPFIYQAQSGDSAALVAASLADAVRTAMICWLTGATITVPNAWNFVARTASAVQALEEWCRQEQGFQIAIWSPTPQLRDLAAQVITRTFAQVGFLDLADGTGGRIRYRSTTNYDADQAGSVYRRNINYDIEYGTTILNINPSMLFADLSENGSPIYA